MARIQALRRLVYSLALILSGTYTALGQPSTIPPPQTTAPQVITGPYRMIVINPRPVVDDSPDFWLFGHSFRNLLNAGPSQADRLNVLRQLPAQAMSGNEAVVDPRWPERVNAVAKTGMTWSIHSLSELGQDAEHGKWLAETITQVVQPQSWTVVNGQKATITYQPHGKALVVYNTPEVQEEVTSFLTKLRQTTAHQTHVPAVAYPPSEKTIIPASFNLGLPAHTTASAGTKGWVVPYAGARQPVGALPEYAHGHAGSARSANPYGGYPVPSVRQPKHLFHFIIRYEGEGIIDANVVDMLKINAGKKDADKDDEKGVADVEEARKTPERLAREGPPAVKIPEKELAKVKWRTDYNAARQEAKDKKLPIVIMFCKDACSMCVKMDKSTFQDALIIGVLNDKFIPVKVGGDSELATALNVESYPCFVFAASDGRIMQRHSVGYKDATAFFDEVLKALDQRHLPDLPLQNVQPAQLLAPPPTAPSLQELPPPSPPSREK